MMNINDVILMYVRKYCHDRVIDDEYIDHIKVQNNMVEPFLLIYMYDRSAYRLHTKDGYNSLRIERSKIEEFRILIERNNKISYILNDDV